MGRRYSEGAYLYEASKDFIPFGGFCFLGSHELLGHKEVKTTMVYTHVLNQGPKGVWSPMDELWREDQACYTETI